MRGRERQDWLIQLANREGYVDDPLPNIHCMYIWLFGCLLALYGSTMHPARL